MDLPTYTNIWRIEKRLYKLYDFRLPMPLPVGQITVFAAIALPYVLVLTLLGVPFSHSLVWLYLLPPGLVTWLVTRPVLEGKRLPELIRSQLRYVAEPRVWCRMAPLAESDVVVVTGRVWRLSAAARAQVGEAAERRGSRSQLVGRLTRRQGGARPVSAPAAAASAARPAPATQRQAPQWQSAQGQAPQWQSAQAQPRSGPARSAPARSGAASARTARAAALRARAAGTSAPPVGQAPVRARGHAGPPPAHPGWALPGSADPGSAQFHPPVQAVPPDQPVVLRDPVAPEHTAVPAVPANPAKWPLRSPTAPPTRSAAAARPRPEPEPTAEPLSIPRQTAFPDAAESTADFAAASGRAGAGAAQRGKRQRGSGSGRPHGGRTAARDRPPTRSTSAAPGGLACRCQATDPRRSFLPVRYSGSRAGTSRSRPPEYHGGQWRYHRRTCAYGRADAGRPVGPPGRRHQRPGHGRTRRASPRQARPAAAGPGQGAAADLRPAPRRRARLHRRRRPDDHGPDDRRGPG